MMKNTFVNTEAGAPITNMRDVQTAGSRGPTLLQDTNLFEHLQIHNRERIPERIVHPRGITVKGFFFNLIFFFFLTVPLIFHDMI